MRYPSIDKLLDVVDSKYKLAIASAKRAKEIIETDQTLVNTECYKAVGKALEEIRDGEVEVVETEK
ncbi:DNA-directed RNA polymerase subunit omega [Mycoplasmatota bacterium WC44]